MTLTEDLLLKLIRIGVGKEEPGVIEDTDWLELRKLADRQGVGPIVCDGIQRVSSNIDQDERMMWAGRVMLSEKKYDAHEKAMVSLARLYEQHGFRMMVLKGWGISLDYPVPDHRMPGDLDIWLFGKWKEGDAMIAEKGIEVDNSHHHHSVFYYKGQMVENHFDFINRYAHRSSNRVEKKLKEWAENNWREMKVRESTIYLPSANFNALFLLRHTISHFAAMQMSIRQLLDWGFFMEHHHQEIDWDEYRSYIKKEGMWRFFNILNKMCVDYLGFDKDKFNYPIEEDELEERVWNDILSPEFKVYKPKTAIGMLWLKSSRWWQHRWKNRLCYPDSMISTFVWGIWAKIVKPTHILH